MHRIAENPADAESVAIAQITLDFEIDGGATAPAIARAALGSFAAVLATDTYLDLRLIISELVTNSVRYGPGEPIGVRVAAPVDGRVKGRVSDGGTGGVAMCEEPTLDRGHGLIIVDSLAASWGVEQGSSTVWFEMNGAYPPPPGM